MGICVYWQHADLSVTGQGRGVCAREPPGGVGDPESVVPYRLSRDATRTVFGSGSRRSWWWGTGRGTGRALPVSRFVGPVGRLLDKALAESGIPREVRYSANVLGHFAPRGDAADPIDGDACDITRRHTWGRHAAILGADRRRQIRGSPLDERGRTVHHQMELERRLDVALARPSDSIDTPTRGSRRRLRTLRCSAVCIITSSSPSKAIHTQLTCGLPSALRVTTCASRPDCTSTRADSGRRVMANVIADLSARAAP